MSELSIYLIHSGFVLVYENVDLNSVTSEMLVNKLIDDKEVPEPFCNREYRFWNKNEEIIPHAVPLAEVGVADGDYLTFVAVQKGK